MKPLFVSHSSHDRAAVDDLRVAMHEVGVACWQDTQRLRVGDGVNPALKAAVQGECGGMIVWLTRAALESAWVEAEVAWALEVDVEELPPQEPRRGPGPDAVRQHDDDEVPAARFPAPPPPMDELRRR